MPLQELATSKSASNGSTQAMPDIVEMMQKIRSENDSISVMEQFGISDNSWRKLRRGEPLRPSVLQRLIQRLDIGAR